MAYLPKPKLLLLQTLLPLLLLLANKVHSQKDVTSFQIDSFPTKPGSKNLIYQGDAHVPSGSSRLNFIKTDSSGVPQRYSIGRVLYSPPVQFWEPGRQSTFETTVKFIIKPPSSGEAADGLAFFIAPVGSKIPNVTTGGSLGIYGSTPLFAVEYDIYANEWDPSYRHVGININSKTSKTNTRFQEALGEEVTALINYNSNTKVITVKTNYGRQTSMLSFVYDLKDILPQKVQVGVSAATGALVSTPELLSWYFTSTLVSTANNVDENAGDAYIRQYG